MSESLGVKVLKGPGSSNPVGQTEKHEQITIEWAAKSMKSEKHEKNEDTVLAEPEHGNFGVFDGAGGHEDGDVASRIARNAASEYINEYYSLDMSPGEVSNIVKEALDGANAAVLEEIKRRGQEEYEKRMASTGTVIKIHTDKKGDTWGIVGHAGDSRLYVYDEQEGLRQITTSDDIISAMIPDKEQAAKIRVALDSVGSEEDLKRIPDGRLYHDNRNVVGNALGRKDTEPTMIVFKIKKGSKIAVVSDAIANLRTREIEAIMKNNQNAEEIASSLVGGVLIASENGENFWHHQDDMSAVVVVAR